MSYIKKTSLIDPSCPSLSVCFSVRLMSSLSLRSEYHISLLSFCLLHLFELKCYLIISSSFLLTLNPHQIISGYMFYTVVILKCKKKTKNKPRLQIIQYYSIRCVHTCVSARVCMCSLFDKELLSGFGHALKTL